MTITEIKKFERTQDMWVYIGKFVKSYNPGGYGTKVTLLGKNKVELYRYRSCE